MNTLTPLQERKARRMFEIFDTNRDGTVKRNDFNLILDKLAQVVPFSRQSETYRGLNYLYQSRWNKMRFFADGDKNEQISVEEWIAYCNSLIEKDSYEDDVLPITCYVIRLFADQNKTEDFKIDVSVFEKFYSAYGIEEKVARQTFEKLDIHKKGYLTEEQITHYWREFYESNDENALGNWFFGKY
jgi:Ca2+-binding EF-hand superfamily protein